MKRVLVVDDEQNILLLYQRELAAAGYQVDAVATVEAAQTAFTTAPPDLIVLDIKLTPQDGGLDVLRWFRERNRTLPIVLNTAYPSYKADFSTWLADAYLVKSSNLDELKATVAKLLEP
jgi:DNA-binding response OmpR family regulator